MRSVELGQQLQVGASRKVWIEGRVLHEAADGVEYVTAEMIQGVTQQHHRAFVGPDQAEQHPQEGRLAGAVGSEQPAPLAGPDDQVHTVDGRRSAEALDQSRRVDRLHAGAIYRAPKGQLSKKTHMLATATKR